MKLIFTISFILIFTLSCFAQSSTLEIQKEIYKARDKVLPALVHVEPIKKVFISGEKERTLVTGSGVVFSEKGYVLTNHHVAENAEKVWCTLSNKKRITASVMGTDPSTDIAVLKLNVAELNGWEIPFAKLGNSDSLQVGQIVLALGSPLGLSRSVSMGVISSIDRYFPNRGTIISPFNLWIQTDAAINPGNSGGPLIDLTGMVIGINARAVFFAENLGFAIPINLVKEVAEEIINGREVTRAWIGIELQQIKDFREYLGIDSLSGVLITQVEENSPAKKAGLQQGSVIQKINNIPVNAEFEEDLPFVRKQLADLPIGKKIDFTMWRNNKEFTKEIQTEAEPLVDKPEFEANELGAVVKNLEWHIYRMQMLQDFNGVYFTGVKAGGPADLANIRNGDVLRKMNDTQITNIDDFRREYDLIIQDQENKTVFLELIRNGHPYYSVIKLNSKKYTETELE
jgi:serine protease Do